MQTRDKKRNFFRGYRHANKSMPKLTGHTRQKSITELNDGEDDETIQRTQIETALEKANAAVLLDSANNFQGAVQAYEEAVSLLQDVLATDPLRNDRSRLQKICDSYTDRIRTLSPSINSTTTNTTITNTIITVEKEQPDSIVVKNMRSVTDSLSPSSSSSWRLPMSKRKAKSRPTSLVHDDNNDDATSAYTVDSTKTNGSSLLSSLFAKKGYHAKYSKENASMHDLSSSSAGPKPSRSTPIAPFNRSPRMWLQNADRIKRHSSDSMDKQGNEQLPPPSLPLPELSATPNDEDYFGFGSVGASDLLINTPASRYSVLNKPTLAKKDTTTLAAIPDDNDESTISNNKNHMSNNNSSSYYLSVNSLLEEAATTSMDDVMDTLVKVMEESNEEAVEADAAVPSIVPPPRKQSIPKHVKKDNSSSSSSKQNSRNDTSAVNTPVERSKSSSSTTSSTSASSSSSPLVPASSSSSNNNGQGLSSFWRAHTFSARRPGQQQQQQQQNGNHSHHQRTSRKKHEPNLPPLNLQSHNNNNNNNPPPSSRASYTRTRSASNASAASRHSVASSSSPTTVSSPSSQTSSRNGWSSFDLQSRPNTSLFSASVPSLALSPRERTQFMDQPKIDPSVFLSDPAPKPGVNDLPLIQRILRCLVDGGYLTDKLYVPKELWHQTNVRLPAVDAKLAACELLIPVLERMNALDNEQQNQQLSEASKEIAMLEQALEQIKECLARKLKLFEKRHDNYTLEEVAAANNDGATLSNSTLNLSPSSSSYHHSPSVSTSNKTSQTIAAWGNKLSKSVERMKLESSRTSDHHHSTYIQALIQVFTSAQVLDSWRMQYTEIIGRVSQDKVLSYALFLSRLQTCAETLEKIVCAFVLRDFTLLLNKWLKRSREWSLE